jgi:hypothetical protein
MKQSMTFSITIALNCLSAVVNQPTDVSESYSIGSAIHTISVSGWSSSIPNCGTIVLSMTGYDSSVFTFDSSALTIKVYIYTLTVKGTLGSIDSSTMTVTVTLVANCDSATAIA